MKVSINKKQIFVLQLEKEKREQLKAGNNSWKH